MYLLHYYFATSVFACLVRFTHKDNNFIVKNEILNNNEIGIKYKAQIDKQELQKLEQDYFIFSTKKYEDNKYSEADLTLYMELIKQHFYQDGIINCPYVEDNNIVDNLLLIPKTIINI